MGKDFNVQLFACINTKISPVRNIERNGFSASRLPTS